MSLGLIDEFAREEALAAEFGVSPRTLRRWSAKPNGLPYTVIGGARLYRIASVKAWLAERERRPNPRRT